MSTEASSEEGPLNFIIANSSRIIFTHYLLKICESKIKTLMIPRMYKFILIGIHICLLNSLTYAQNERVAKNLNATSGEPSTKVKLLGSEIDLETAVLFSLNQNPNIKISSADVALRTGQLQSARGEFDWTPFTSAEFRRTEAPILTLLSPTDTLISETLEYSIGVRKKFRNGIVITPSVSAEFETIDPSAVETSATSLWNLEVLIPLLRGRGTTSANSLENALDNDLKAAQLAYLQVLSDQTLATLIAYWRCAAARARVDVLKNIEQRALDLVDTTNAMIEAKILSASVLPQAKANLNDQKALSLDAEIDYSSQRYNFALALGMQPEKFVSIPLAKLQKPTLGTVPSIDNSELISVTNARRADINSIRKTLKGRSILVDGAERDLLPRLDLTLSTGYTGGNSDRDTFSVLQDNIRGANFGIELNMDFPVGNNLQRGSLSQRQAEFYQVEQQLISLKQRVVANAMEALEIVKLASERLRVIQDTELQYQEAVSIATKRFTEGEATVFELIDMEGRYARSTIDSITAVRDYYIAIGRLRFATGTLFKELSTNGSFTLNELDTANILKNKNLNLNSQEK